MTTTHEFIVHIQANDTPLISTYRVTEATLPSAIIRAEMESRALGYSNPRAIMATLRDYDENDGRF